MKKSKLEKEKELNEKFFQACSSGDLDTVKELYGEISKKKSVFSSFLDIFYSKPILNPHYKNAGGFTNACKYGHTDIVSVFLQHNDFIFQSQEKGSFALGLTLAIDNFNSKIVEMLIPLVQERNDEFYDEVANGFLDACKHGELNMVKTIINLVDIDHLRAYGHSIKYQGFIEACESGQIDVVKYYIEEPDLNRYTKYYEVLNHQLPIVHDNILNYFIIDLNIEKNDPFMINILSATKDKIYDKKSQYEQLNKELNSSLENQIKNKKPKI